VIGGAAAMLMTNGMPRCSATCAMAPLRRNRTAPTSSCAPSLDQPLGARARDVDVGLGVGVHDVERRQPEIGEHLDAHLDATVAVLADAGLHARARQQHADAQSLRLRADDTERGKR
jgi:hypothetical protein